MITFVFSRKMKQPNSNLPIWVLMGLMVTHRSVRGSRACVNKVFSKVSQKNKLCSTDWLVDPNQRSRRPFLSRRHLSMEGGSLSQGSRCPATPTPGLCGGIQCIDLFICLLHTSASIYNHHACSGSSINSSRTRVSRSMCVCSHCCETTSCLTAFSLHCEETNSCFFLKCGNIYS